MPVRLLQHNNSIGKTKKRNISKAVRILAEPFPVPPVCESTVNLPDSGKIGIRFRWNGKPGDRVKIVAIDPDSPIVTATTQSSSSSSQQIRPGHTVLAVNGVPALKSTQVGHLIRSAGRKVTLTTCQEGRQMEEGAPFCKVLTAPGGRRHPGINLDSTRDRCLVRITRVFPHGPFCDRELREGDILLAVNGVAVSKPEEADRRLQEASLHFPYIHLYVLDIASYRESVVEEIQASSRLYEGLSLMDNLDGSSRNHYLLRDSISNSAFPVQFNPETQRILDNGISLQGKRSYRDLIRPFIKAYNEGMEERMRLLEEAVSGEAWKSSCDVMERRGRQGSYGGSSDEENSSTGSNGSGQSTPTCGSPVVAETIQVAAAELIVFPLEAIQTLDERINHQTLLTSI